MSQGVQKLTDANRSNDVKQFLGRLSSIDHSTEQARRLRKRQNGTGDWFLTSPEFTTWENNVTHVLLCSGIHGAGKSIMTSIVVNYLHQKYSQNSDVGIAYVYFNYESKELDRHEHHLSSILKQLLEHRPALISDVMGRDDSLMDSQFPLDGIRLKQLLTSAMQSYSKIFIVLDALDEFYDLNYEEFQNFLMVIFEFQKQAPVKLFATTRDIPEILSQFKDVHVRKEIRAHDQDLCIYINTEIPKLSRFHLTPLSDANKDMVREKIVDAVDGM